MERSTFDEPADPGASTKYTTGDDSRSKVQDPSPVPKKRWDNGSMITVMGLAGNLGLAILKGLAGMYTNSTFLMADAGHSLGDLLGDLITLIAWILSRRVLSKPRYLRHDKLEAIGTLVISLMIAGGGIVIGSQVYLSALELVTPQNVAFSYFSRTFDLPSLQKERSSRSLVPKTGNGNVLNPSAAWFALIGIIVKEVLYRITKRVAEEESSSLLAANALHHRSDAYTSGIVLVSILGSIAGAPILDPLGGLVVSIVMIKQGVSLFFKASDTILQ